MKNDSDSVSIGIENVNKRICICLTADSIVCFHSKHVRFGAIDVNASESLLKRSDDALIVILTDFFSFLLRKCLIPSSKFRWKGKLGFFVSIRLSVVFIGQNSSTQSKFYLFFFYAVLRNIVVC